ncbi:efflux RND transporter periplasmic adaptor subunit [Pseudanabaena galeata UHCC 0370]|uniref:Efflux RND transporter periplasmic adaptor subunit n=1 Tax=Pseudanabaena galeata UHCC 0370 TaxID=3110310 RepID=A0ABU5TPB2_9CYAN|nr:efflux RND transporter periplasmic adaptor subunit [Pseudanabaena galeata]MEA5480019.1 efflux RND transporter periplasmic adaptor subunit [Pseudanabaena galeata UHCC 0370]
MKRIYGACLSLVLLVNPLLNPVAILAHAGHGDEFGHGDAIANPSAIEIDQNMAQKVGIKVEAVSKKAMAIAIKATGQIEPLPDGKVKVTSPIKGTLISLLVQPGDKVEAGQVVAVLSSPELTDLRVNALEKQTDAVASVQEAIANLQFAKQNYGNQQQIVEAELRQAETELKIDQERYDRDRELLASGAIARRQFQESESRFLAAKSNLSKASGRLPLLEAAAQVTKAEAMLEAAQSRIELSGSAYAARLRQLDSNADADGRVTIAAPISGVVSDREATIGEGFEEAGKPIMTIVNDRRVFATANIFEKDINRIKIGQKINVTVAGISTNSPTNTKLQGTITTIGSVIAGEQRVIPVKAEINNANGQLKAGMFAELELLTSQALSPVIAIPAIAVVDVQGKKLVYVQNGKAFEPTEVELGQVSDGFVEVKSGLFEGDRIVTEGAPLLYAQSLRGNPNKAAVEETKVDSNNALSLPWWSFLIATGVVGGAVYGGYWLGKRKNLAANNTNNVLFSPNSIETIYLPSLPTSAATKTEGEPE